MFKRAILRALTAVSFAIFAATQVNAQTVTRVFYPPIEFVNAYGGPPGTAADIRLAGGNGQYFVSRIVWGERRDRPCYMRVEIANINNPNDVRTGGEVDNCNGNPRGLRALDMTSPNYRRGGVPVSLTACINNGRLKGIRALVNEIQGDREFRAQDGTFTDYDFVPDINPGRRGLPDTVDFSTGPRPQGPDARRYYMQDRRTNCGRNDWEDIQACSGLVIVGVIAVGAGTGTITDLRPVCARPVLVD